MARLDDHIGAIVKIASDESQRCNIAGIEIDEWISQLYILAAERWNEYDEAVANPYTWLNAVIRPRLVDAMFRAAGFYRGMEGERGHAVKCVRRPVQNESDVSSFGFESMAGIRVAVVPRADERKRYTRLLVQIRTKARRRDGERCFH